MSFVSVLDNVGHALKVFFTGATKIAAIAEPIIDVAFPGFATLYNAGVSEVLAAENAAIAAGTQTGSGTQKLAYVLGSPSFISAVQQFETTAGASFNQTQQAAFINAIVAALNAVPSSSSYASISNNVKTPAVTPTISANLPTPEEEIPGVLTVTANT